MTDKNLIAGVGRQSQTMKKPGSRSGFVLLALLLAVLSGCAEVGNKGLPAAKAEQPASAPETAKQEAPKPGLTTLSDGRIGFVIQEVPHNPEAWQADFTAAVDSLNAHEDARAVELLEKVVGQEPGVTAPYIDLAIAYRRLGKSKQAEEKLKKALELVPAHPVASNEYGLLLRKSGRFAEARSVYEQALDKFPDYFPLRRNLGILCDIYLNDLECALNQFELYGKAQPEDEKMKIWLAELHQRLGH